MRRHFGVVAAAATDRLATADAIKSSRSIGSRRRPQINAGKPNNATMSSLNSQPIIQVAAPA